MKYAKFLKKTGSEFIRDFTSLGNPFILAIISVLVLGFTIKLAVIILGLIVVEISCSLIKFFYYKERPNKEEHNNIIEQINAGSFPSLHAARSSFVFMSLFILSNNPVIKIIFILLLIIVGLTRVLLKKHYVSDIFVGYIIGILTFLIWELMKWV